MLNRLRTFSRSAPVVVSILTLSLFAALSAWDVWRRLELKGYDLLMVTSAPGKSALPITIVGIDEPSFAQIKQQWPWPRRMHGELLEQLNRAGALVVAFDVLLSEPSNEEDDKLFASAIAKAVGDVKGGPLAYTMSGFHSRAIRMPSARAIGSHPMLESGRYTAFVYSFFRKAASPPGGVRDPSSV